MSMTSAETTDGCFLRPRNISVPSYRPRQRQDKRYTFSSEGSGSGEEQHTSSVDNFCCMSKACHIQVIENIDARDPRYFTSL